jgi:hypothetical protein
MSLWIESPDLSDETGRRLHNLLADGIPDMDDLRQLWVTVGFKAADMAWQGKTRNVWLAILLDAGERGKLRELIVAAGKLRPALASDLGEIVAAPAATSAWYTTPNPFVARLLGPGNRRSLIDRSTLSLQLRQVEESEYLVFNIRGEPGSGKSHSRHLVQHVVAKKAGRKLIQLDVAEEWPDRMISGQIDAREFTRVLAQKVRINSTFDVDERTDATRISRDLANMFVARFGELPREPRWIFIDGLDRPAVLVDVHVFVAHIALAVERGELGPQTRLIVTGHPGDFAASVQDVLVEEDIEKIDRSHVEQFFGEVSAHVGAPLDGAEIAELTDRVLERAALDDLRRLGRAACEVARERFEKE